MTMFGSLKGGRELDRLVRQREEQAAAKAAASASAAAEYGRMARQRLWDEIQAAVPAALAAIKRSPDSFPDAQTLYPERRTLFGGYKRYPIAGFKIVSYKYLGREQTSVTPDYLLPEAIIYLLSDGRLADDAEGLTTVLEKDYLGMLLGNEGFLRRIPLDELRDRLKEFDS